MLIERPLASGAPTPALSTLITAALESFAQVPAVTAAPAPLHEFITDRLRGWLRDRGYPIADIDAVLSIDADQLDRILPRLDAIAQFRALPQAASLAAANKRIGNILRKADPGDALAEVREDLLAEDAERSLFKAIATATPAVEARLGALDYAGALGTLALLREPVDTFFDAVMVNAEDAALRRNRLALLGGLHRLMNRVADLSKLAA